MEHVAALPQFPGQKDFYFGAEVSQGRIRTIKCPCKKAYYLMLYLTVHSHTEMFTNDRLAVAITTFTFNKQLSVLKIIAVARDRCKKKI